MGALGSELPGGVEWRATPLGAIEDWSGALRSAVEILVGSTAPAWIWWGPDATTIMNDACARTFGARAQGLPAASLVDEPWIAIRDRAAPASAVADDVTVVIDRGDGPVEAHFLPAVSSIRTDDDGAGTLCILSETTTRVRERRRLETLFEMARAVASSRTVDEALRSAIAALGKHALDLPFALLYRVDEPAGVARLAAATGTPQVSPTAPAVVPLTGVPSGWPLATVFEAGRGEIVTQLDRIGIPDAPGQPRRAVALPIKLGGRVEAFLCAGIAPLRRLDEDLRGFLDHAVGQIAMAIANARAHQSADVHADRLADLDRRKTAFFVDVTHEFRTPLTLATSAIEDALIEAKEAMQADRLRMAHRNIQRLHKLVNSLLDFARIEANHLRASFAPTDLARLTIDVASSFEAVCEQVGLRLVIDCPPHGEPVHVDQQMWEKIVLNLLSNAFKHTFFGKIEVALRSRDDVVELLVTDTGTGISAQHLPRLFDRFYRVHGGRARTAEGTGIGLATVRELARWHGGDVTVDSTPGAGSQFRVTVKRGTAHLPAEQIDARHFLMSRTTRSGFTEEARQWIVDDLADRVPVGPIGTRPRILWADDNADMRAYVRQILSAEFEVVAVSNGEAALDAIRSKAFDLVLADVMMPGMDGLALLDALRAEAPGRRTPVLLLSGRSSEDAAVEALERGADEYLVKPVSARRLIASVRSHLQHARDRKVG